MAVNALIGLFVSATFGHFLRPLSDHKKLKFGVLFMEVLRGGGPLSQNIDTISFLFRGF